MMETVSPITLMIFDRRTDSVNMVWLVPTMHHYSKPPSTSKKILLRMRGLFRPPASGKKLT